MSALASIQLFLADGGDSPANVDPTTGHGPEWGKAAPIGLLVIVLLCVAVYFLVKSMNRNLKKVPESFAATPMASVTARATSSAASEGVVPGPPVGESRADPTIDGPPAGVDSRPPAIE